MKKIIFLFLTVCLLSCDDGDFDKPVFDFSDTDISICKDKDILLYITNENESIAIDLDENNTDDVFFTKLRSDDDFPLSESGRNTIVYRTFNDAPTANYFCQNIPPTSPAVISEWIGTGTLLITTTATIDDEDNVPAESEGLDTNGDLINDDVDNDDIDNYLDNDDDGDGVLTKAEDIDRDGDPTNDDTDGDTIPNYLDDDDDNDGVLTLSELLGDTDGDGDLNYLDSDNADRAETEREPANNIFIETFLSIFNIEGLTLTNTGTGNIIQYDTYFFGDYDKEVPRQFPEDATTSLK